MRVTQGTFSFLPDLTDEEIEKELQYCLDNDWPVSIEWTEDPHPRNVYWDMWGPPMFDMKEAAAILEEVRRCRAAHPDDYVRVNGYDRRLGRQTTALSFLVNRPAHEPGFRLDRAEGADRRIGYSVSSYAAQRPSGQRDREG